MTRIPDWYSSHRLHWREKRLESRRILIFDDDRATFTALWVALNQEWISEPPLLIRIDKHHDCKPMTKGAQDKWVSLGADPDPRAVWDFVEWDLDPIDGDWVTAVAYARLVRGVLTFYLNPDERHDWPCESLTGIPSWSFGRLSGLLGNQGQLMDEVPAGNRRLWEEIGWDSTSGEFGLDSRPFVISIDIDAFTTSESDSPTTAWPRRWFKEEFETPYSRFGRTFSVQGILSKAVQSAPLVTIAREPDFSGGEVEVAEILLYLDELIFHGGLGIQ